MFPMSLEEKIPANALVRLVSQIVIILILAKLSAPTKEAEYHPEMMLKLVIFAYLNNVYSCRKIEKQNLENIH